MKNSDLEKYNIKISNGSHFWFAFVLPKSYDHCLDFVKLHLKITKNCFNYLVVIRD